MQQHSASMPTPESMSVSESEFDFRQILTALRRRRAVLLLVAALIFVVSVALAAFLPAVYQSEAVVLIEQQEIPSELVRSTVTSYADQRIQVISQRVMTSANLLEIMEKYNLYEEERERATTEAILEQMREDIEIEMISADVVDPRSGKPTQATIAFRLSFENTNPLIAQKVANELVSLYLNENIKTRTEAATETASFLADEAERLGRRVAELEEQLAAFKSANAENRPELEELTRQMMNRTELEIFELDRRVDSAVQQKVFLEGELAQLEPFKNEPVGRGITPVDRLEAVEAELAAAEASYGDAHPDVVRLRKQASGLRAEVDPASARELIDEQLAEAREQLAVAQENYGKDHPDVQKAERKVDALRTRLDALPAKSESTPMNPGYISLRARLEAVNSELRSLASKRDQLRAKYDEGMLNLMKIPDAEAEYRALTREYENTLAKHREVAAKQMEARLSQNLETERKGEKFTLIEPPLEPEEPASPNRPLIVLVGLILATAGGLGGAGVAEALDNRVRGRRGITALLGVPPLAAIPNVPAPGDRTIGQRRLAFVVAGCAGAVAVLAVIHFAYRPLDVLWFIILRKAGL